MAGKRTGGPDREGTGRALRALAVASTIGLLIVIVIGFLDTFTHSALGCGRMWPLCNGGFVPGPSLQSQVEYAHRAITGVVSVLIAVTVIWAGRRYRAYPEVPWMGAVGLGFVVVQAIVGAAAVLWPEAPPVMATHFGFAILSFAGVSLMTLLLFQLAPGAEARSGYALRRRAAEPRLRSLVLGLLVYTLGVAYWGAYVAHAGVGGACVGWPLCNGSVWPPLTPSVTIVMIHRLAAIGELIFVAIVFVVARRGKAERPDLYRAAHVALALVVLQVLSGAALILSGLSTGWDVLHVALVSVLFAAVGYLAIQVHRPLGPRVGRRPAPS
jgi:cytochrome c oxidase assembly protein subunit 15